MFMNLEEKIRNYMNNLVVFVAVSALVVGCAIKKKKTERL